MKYKAILIRIPADRWQHFHSSAEQALGIQSSAAFTVHYLMQLGVDYLQQKNGKQSKPRKD